MSIGQIAQRQGVRSYVCTPLQASKLTRGAFRLRWHACGPAQLAQQGCHINAFPWTPSLDCQRPADRALQTCTRFPTQATKIKKGIKSTTSPSNHYTARPKPCASLGSGNTRRPRLNVFNSAVREGYSQGWKSTAQDLQIGGPAWKTKGRRRSSAGGSAVMAMQCSRPGSREGALAASRARGAQPRIGSLACGRASGRPPTNPTRETKSAAAAASRQRPRAAARPRRPAASRRRPAAPAPRASHASEIRITHP